MIIVITNYQLSYLKYDDTTAFIAGSQEFSIMIELHAGYDIRIGDIIV